MACVEPALWGFAAKHDIHSQCISRFSLSRFRPTISTVTCRCASGPFSIGSKSFQVPLSSTGASWSARSRKKEKGSVYGVDRFGLDSFVDRKVSERDASVTTSEEGGALELVDTEGIIFEEGDDINGMLRQPRSYLDDENWQMFAAEEGARPTDDDETESGSEMEDGSSGNLVRRRKAEEVLLPFPDSPAVNWNAADKEKVQALHAFQHK